MSPEPQSLSSDALRALSRFATAVILLGAGLAVAILAMALPRYHPELGMDQVVTFYVIPVVVVLALLATFRFSVETRIGLAILMVVTGVTLTGVEAVLLLVGAVEATSASEAGSPVFDKIAEHRSAGDPATPSVSGNSLIRHGLAVPVDSAVLRPVTTGPGNRTTVFCAEFIAPVSYRSDRYGFNNTDAVWDRDTIDITLIGDSYTAGVCVNREHQIASYLSDPLDVINLGVRGIGPFQELAILREYGGLRPTRHVVWIFYEGNDVWDLRGTEQSELWLHEYLDPAYTQELAANQGAIDHAYGAWLDSLVAAGPEDEGGDVRPGIISLLASAPRLAVLRRLIGFGVLPPERGSQLAQLPEILELAREEVRGAGGEFHVLYLPAFGRFTTRVGEGMEGRREFLRLMDEMEMSFVDLVPVFEATGSPKEMWANPRGHLSPEGYRVVADVIREMVRH